MARDIDFENDITEEMFEIVAKASLYREDPALELKKVVPKAWTVLDTQAAIKYIQSQKERLEEVKQNYIDLETAALVEDNQATIMLVYNKLLQQAQKEGKYEVATRILKEIRQMKAIENEQMKFEIVITIDDGNRKENK